MNNHTGVNSQLRLWKKTPKDGPQDTRHRTKTLEY